MSSGTELCCRTCRLKVSRIQDPDGRVWYAHHGPRDHEVEPVAMATADVIHVCDFCLAPHPGWCFPLLEHASTTSAPHPDLGFNVKAEDTDGWWAACQVCMELVAARQIGKLRDRALAVAVVRRGPLSAWEKQGVIDQLAAFWLAVPGPPVEIT
jgi:hypothetical protein